ncbi:MAG TPA: hypothetical protein ENK66_08300 [Arcobacter sp.]|jgi:WD40 repeat protein|nr:hypothetical protein [Arcobacter sp.]
MKLFFLSLGIILFFSACSSREYYEPEESKFFTPNTITTTPSYIQGKNANGATLESQNIITTQGISEVALPKGFYYLNHDENTILAADSLTSLMIIGENNSTINLKRTAVAATKENNLIALVFSDNSIAIYDTNKDNFIFKEYAQHSFFNDIRIASPIILKNIILFPTLDGKVLIVDKNTNQIIRTINIDPNSQVNNVILLTAIGDTLIAATQNKIISVKDGAVKSLEFFIQNYYVSDKGIIYITKHDGTVASFDANLNELHSKKFKFAKFLTLNLDKQENIYALELGGYLIKINPDFSKTTVYRFPLEDDEKMFAMKNKIYFENKILYLDINNTK